MSGTIVEIACNIHLQIKYVQNNSPKQHSVKKESAAPQPKLYSATADLLTIRPDDSPGIKKLKRLASLDSTELDKFQEELKAKENGSPTLAIPSEDTFIFLYGKLENLLNDAKARVCHLSDTYFSGTSSKMN